MASAFATRRVGGLTAVLGHGLGAGCVCGFGLALAVCVWGGAPVIAPPWPPPLLIEFLIISPVET